MYANKKIEKTNGVLTDGAGLLLFVKHLKKDVLLTKKKLIL
jgi:hypothetical protein